ncbi:uncharacterized protein A4U43_C03F18830 [Asparagus officinalis]|uniref:Uncharacterized protein n=1 Tax=Asparagus officinalis TaxID=4686 RepID=A0A5P1FD24_ASPOF|nr:uncharacterized protein A4U43_C03F18830 [Asparagus officinalis]
MEPWSYADGNITTLLESRRFDPLQDVNRRLQMHSSLVQRLALEKEMKGHEGCVNTIAWNSKGTLLISGSDDMRINIWSYSDRKLIHSIDTGHSSNIFCTKFVPETCDELVVSGAGDAEVRLFNLSRSRRRGCDETFVEPSAVFQCHSRRVKKLAVEVGNPNVVWSASEDGTVRQHDFREGSSCPPPAGSSNQECRNVLLDLRSGAKRSLSSPPIQYLALKSLDISSTRPHQILVGGSDAFARLYDRRMLPPLSSCRTKMKPSPCISYFCPMHLSERRRSSLHLTHVTFSPNGEEVLLSYSGEHVYLMDVNFGNQSIGYTADDVPMQIYLSPTSKESEGSSPPSASSTYFTASKNNLRRFDMYKKLVQAAEKILNEGSNFLYGIEACNEVLDGKGPEIGNALRHECLCIRAALLLKRKWKNDAHMAIRDCNIARRIAPSSFKAHYYMSKALSQLRKHKEALDYAMAAHNIAPSNPEASERILNIKADIAAAEAEKHKDNGGTRRQGRIRSLNLKNVHLTEKILIMMGKWNLILKHQFLEMRTMILNLLFFVEA